MQISQQLIQYPTISVEITPSIDASALDKIAALRPDFISLTDKATTAGQRKTLLELANHLQNQMQIPVLMHVTGLYKSKAMVWQWIRELQNYHLNNVLALRGDVMDNHAPCNDFPHADDLIQYLRSHFSDLDIASSCYPTADITALKWLIKKENVGSNFFISQFSFDTQLYTTFFNQLAHTSLTSPIVAGIMPILNPRQVEKMTQLGHMGLPNELQAQIAEWQKQPTTFRHHGMQFTIKQMHDLWNSGIQHFHLYSLNDAEAVQMIMTDFRR